MSNQRNPQLWQLQADVNIDGLVKALTSDDARIRQRAAAALRAMKATSALPHLRSAYATEGDAATRDLLATAIVSMSDEPLDTTPDVGQVTVEAPAIAMSFDELVDKAEDEDELDDDTNPKLEKPLVNQLLDKLQSSNVDDVVQATKGLASIGDKIAVEPLILLFKDATLSIRVRLAVAEALLELESAPVEVALLANLRHPDWHIRRNGAAILGQLKADWAIDPLAQALRDPHPVVRRTARAALKHIGTPDSRKALAQYAPTNKDRQESVPPQTAGGQPIKRVSEVRKPHSKMLARLEDEQEQQNPRSVNKMTTQRLDADNVPENPPDKQATHTRPTRPLDPSVLDEFEKGE